MVLEANIDIIIALRKFYVGLKSKKEFPVDLKRSTTGDISTFSGNLEGIIAGLKMHASRAKLLVSIIADRKELVSGCKTASAE